MNECWSEKKTNSSQQIKTIQLLDIYFTRNII